MGVRINTNIEALNAQRNLSATAMAFGKSVEKLSSGLRINRAADDSAGLAISENLRAQVKGLNQAQRNAQDGISMVQTAEGALNEVHSMLQRMRELSVQASNSTLSASDLGSVKTEILALQSEINRIATSTTFNNQHLLDGTLGVKLNTATSTAQAGAAVVAGTGTGITAVAVSGAKASTTYTATDAAGVLTLTDGANSQAIDLTGVTVAAGGSYSVNFDKLGISITVASRDGETGTNISGGLTGLTVITTAQAQANFQIGANSSDALGVSFGDNQTSAGLNTAISNFSGAGLTIANAQALITAVNTEIGTVSSKRGAFGAIQNRLEHTVASLGVASENLAASESRIRDVDVAAEMVNFTKSQILQQAGTAILAQANSAPNSVLQLLR